MNVDPHLGTTGNCLIDTYCAVCDKCSQLCEAVRKCLGFPLNISAYSFLEPELELDCCIAMRLGSSDNELHYSDFECWPGVAINQPSTLRQENDCIEHQPEDDGAEFYENLYFESQ